MAYFGIDLGTTRSAVSVVNDAGHAVIVPNRDGEPTTPSALLFESDREVAVGRVALRAAATEPGRVALDTKRFMGDTAYPLPLPGGPYSPVLLSAVLLKKLARDAADRVGPPGGVVVTVPAYFNEARRQATAAACKVAGLPLLDIINEPTAAALGFAWQQRQTPSRPTSTKHYEHALFHPRTLVVYDLGGGTFDVTVLRSEGRELRVLATSGDVQLGGRDWDHRIADHLATLFADVHGADPREDPVSHQALLETAEEVKKELSDRPRARYTLHHDGHSFSGEFSRTEFEELTADLLFRTESRLTRAMQDAGTNWADVAEVLAVGGSTRMPAVTRLLESTSGRPLTRTADPDTAVAQGAAVHAAVCAARGQRPGQPSATSPALPASQVPDGVLARLGRVAQLLRRIRTVSVSAHSLGVVAHNAEGQPRIRRMVPRQTALPFETTHTFGIQKDHQRRVTVQIVEGESDLPEHAYPVGTCHISKLPASLPKGSPVEVHFRYDAGGRLSVKALHVASGQWAETVIERKNGVDPQHIRRHHEALTRVALS